MNRNILNLRQLTVLLILCTAFLGGIIPAFAQQGGKKITGHVIDDGSKYPHRGHFYRYGYRL